MSRTNLLDMILLSLCALCFSLLLESCTSVKKSSNKEYSAYFSGCMESVEPILIVQHDGNVPMQAKMELLEYCSYKVQEKFSISDDDNFFL